MILKSIEIRGFKSFADSTELIFKGGITSVIGPNGSGKSNIYDAIRWCLGEQSAKSLRGGKMEDVIFAGTQYRKPISLAQVSLTIDNSSKGLPIEYSTVIISRKLYRSGESEYSINNKPCKLKDIHELFFDTGIGKEGYSLIGQGKIDTILNGSSDDRRTIIEEAIGITKYKFKREEAYSKINNANENLVRIDDMLLTYSEYLEPLKVESDKAKRFLELSSQLKDVEILILYNNLYGIYNDMTNTEDVLKKSNVELSGFVNDKDLLENKRIILEKELDNLKIIEQKDKRKYDRIKEIIQQHVDTINLKKNDINVLISSNQIYEKQINENKVKIDNILLRENIINKTKMELENEFNSLAIKLEEDKSLNERNNTELRNLERQLNDIKIEQNNIVNENNNIKNKIDFINASFVNIDNDKKMYFDEKVIIEDKILNIENNVKERKLKLETLKFKEKDLKILSNDLLVKINSQNKIIDTFNQKMNELSKALVIKQANLDALKEFEDSYEGFNKASKLLMNEIKSGTLNRFKDKCFIIGNVLDTDDKYSLAIETAIGGHISDIIIDDYIFARDLIDYLKNNKLGRVTFHPLNSVNKFNVRFNESVRAYEGFVDFAINLVNIDEKFDKVISNILGNTIICDNIDNALSIANKINFSNRIVTLDSQVINSGGSITGGSSYVKKFNILGRQKKISKESEDIRLQMEHMSNLKSKMEDHFKDRNRFQSELDANTNALQNVTIEIMRINEELRRYEDIIQRENIELEKKNIILKNLSDTSSSNDNEINKLNEELELNKQRFDLLEADYLNMEIQIKDHRRLILDEEDKITNIKIRKAKLEENISNIYEESKRIALEKGELLQNNSKINYNITLNNSSVQKMNNSIDNLNARVVSLKDNLSQYNFDSYVVEQNRFQEEIKKLNSEINDLYLSIHKAEQEINSLKIRNSKKEVEFNINNDNLFNKYSIKFDINDQEKYRIDDSEMYKYTLKAKKINSDISDLGNINLKSIEEYEALNEKVKFITYQKDDLEKSKTELEEFIKDITFEMRNIFSENFKIINENFNITFKELFKGGNAQLMLGEGDELESKIEIIVQPPGKKLQNINLLSGGEKGLSAIALLFAILKLKPVPFCVLDEIEAALDDNNVIKFATFLKKYSQNVQFIVITHRKPTMESSDVIYGVTMEEKGVSKVVSINLANYNT